MNMLKNLKIYLLLLMTSLGTFCLCSDNNNEAYDNLCTIIKEGKFAKFKNLYSSIDLSEMQKDELIKMADEIIELEQKNWPKNKNGSPNLYWGEISKTTGNHIKTRIKILLFLMGFSIGAIIPLSFWCANPLSKSKEFWNALRLLQNGNAAIPAGSTAASMATDLDIQKNYWVQELVKWGSCILIYSLTGSAFFSAIKNNKKILASYKRHKGAAKIKQFLLGPVELLKSMDPKPAHGECSEAKSNPLRVF